MHVELSTFSKPIIINFAFRFLTSLELRRTHSMGIVLSKRMERRISL